MRRGVRGSSRPTSAWRRSARRSRSDGRHVGAFSSVWWSSSSTTVTFGGNRWMTTTSRMITAQLEGLEMLERGWRALQPSASLCVRTESLSGEYQGISSCLYLWVDLKQRVIAFNRPLSFLWVHSRLMNCRVMVSPGWFACVHYMKDELQAFHGAAAHL